MGLPLPSEEERPIELWLTPLTSASPQQMRAMIELLPLHAPKLSAVGVGYLTGEDFASRLERTINRSSGAKLVEARAIEGGRW